MSRASEWLPSILTHDTLSFANSLFFARRFTKILGKVIECPFSFLRSWNFVTFWRESRHIRKLIPLRYTSCTIYKMENVSIQLKPCRQSYLYFFKLSMKSHSKDRVRVRMWGKGKSIILNLIFFDIFSLIHPHPYPSSPILTHPLPPSASSQSHTPSPRYDSPTLTTFSLTPVVSPLTPLSLILS